MIWLLIRLVGASRSSSKRARVPGVHLACGWRVDAGGGVGGAVRREDADALLALGGAFSS